MKAKDRRNKCKCIIGKSECISCKFISDLVFGTKKNRTKSLRFSAV